MRIEYRKKFDGNLLILVVLLILGIVPGIIYYLFKQGQVRCCGECKVRLGDKDKCPKCGAEVY